MAVVKQCSMVMVVGLCLGAAVGSLSWGASQLSDSWPALCKLLTVALQKQLSQSAGCLSAGQDSSRDREKGILVERGQQGTRDGHVLFICLSLYECLCRH